MIGSITQKGSDCFTPSPPVELALPIAGVLVAVSIYMIHKRRKENVRFVGRGYRGNPGGAGSSGTDETVNGIDGQTGTNTVLCNCCGVVDGFGRYDAAVDAARDHHGRQTDGLRHDIAVFELADGREYVDLLDYWDRIVDKGSYPLETLKHRHVPAENVKIIKDSDG